MCHLLGLLRGVNRSSRRTLDFTLLKNLIKNLTVLCRIHVLGIGSQNRNAHLRKAHGQLDGRLSAELYHRIVRMLDVHNVLHILRCQRLEVKLVCNIKVCGNRLRVVIDDDGLIAFSCKGPSSMHGAVVELDSLSDPDRAGAKDKNLLAVRHALLCLIRIRGIVDRIEIRSLRLKLRGTGVYHLVARRDAVVIAHLRNFFLRNSGPAGNDAVRELHALCLFQKLLRQRFLLKLLLHADKIVDLIDEPLIHHGDLVNGLTGNALAKRFRNHPDSLVIHNGQANEQLLLGKMAEIIAVQCVHMLLQGTDCLHQAALEVRADAHDLAGCLHLGCQRSLRVNKLIERKTGELHHAVVQCRLEGRIGLSGHRVLDLIQRKAKCDLRRNLCDRIAGRLGGKSRGTGHTGIYLNDTVFKARRMQRKLYVAAAGNLQLINDVQCRCTQHLIFLVGKCLGRSHNDGVTGVHADRIQVFHVADGDAVSCSVAHHFVLDFLPAGDAALHQNLPHSRKTETVLKNLAELCRIMCNTAAGAAQRVGRTQNNREADLFCEFYTVFHVLNDIGGCDRLADLLHGFLEHLAVLCLFNGQSRCSEELYAVSFQKSGFCKLHAKVQSGLSAQCREDGVRLLLLNNLLQDLGGQRLNVDLIRNVLIGHNGRGVGVYKAYLHALFLQRAARLCTRIVELRRLSDDNRAGANHHYLFYIFSFRHDYKASFPSAAVFRPSLIFSRKRSKRNPESCGPGQASGWNCTVKMFLPL